MLELKKIIPLIMILLVSCSSGSGGGFVPSGGGGSVVVTITPVQPIIKVGKSVQLLASIKRDGNLVDSIGIGWVSSNPTIASVDPDSGLVTGVAGGKVMISAHFEAVVGTATITVTDAEIATIELLPKPDAGADSLVMLTGDTINLAAQVFDVDGDQVSTVSVKWSSSAAPVLLVSPSGQLSALTAGSAVITAAAGGISSTLNVEVQSHPVGSITLTPGGASITTGGTLQLQAIISDNQGNLVKGLQLGWVSSNDAVATVSDTGLVKGLAVGIVEISAQYNGVASSMVSITITGSAGSGAPASLTVTPEKMVLQRGDKGLIVAVILDTNGAPLDPLASELDSVDIRYSSGDTAIARVTGSGVVTAVSVGVTTITITSGSLSATVTLLVSAVDVATIDISPAAATLSPATTQQFSAVVKDSGGSRLSNLLLEWKSSNPAVVSVNSSGLATAVGAGGDAAVITAGYGNVLSGQVSVFVSQKVSGSVSVTVSPLAVSVYVAETVQMSAVVSGSSVQDVVWSVDGSSAGNDMKNGTVSSTGLYRAPAMVPASGVAMVRVSPTADLSKSYLVKVTLLPRFQAKTDIVVADGAPSSAVVGDFNADDRADIAVVSNKTGRVLVYLSSAGGTYLFDGGIDLGVAGSGFYRLAKGDVNLDGSLDIISSGFDKDKIFILSGDGTGSFSVPSEEVLLPGSLPVSVAGVNIFGTGLDIVTGSFMLDSLSVFIAVGDGSFTGTINVPLPAGAVPFDIATGDINGDGQDDIAVVDIINDKLYILTGDSTGLTLLQTVDMAVGIKPYAVDVVDMDNDGNNDLVTANRQDGSLAVFLNLNGQLSDTPLFYMAGGTLSDIGHADLNHDGTTDIVVTDRGGDRMVIFYGKGDGTLLDSTVVLTDAAPVSLDVADLDADGQLDDIVTVNINNNSFSVFINE